jgi:hypothetical protein
VNLLRSVGNLPDLAACAWHDPDVFPFLGRFFYAAAVGMNSPAGTKVILFKTQSHFNLDPNSAVLLRTGGVFALNLRFHTDTKLFVALLFFTTLFQGESVSLAAQTSSDQLTKPVTSETVERTLRSQWRGLFETHSWTVLDSLADRLRSQRLRFQGGGWQLHVLYTILSTVNSPSETDAAWDSQIASLQEWIRLAPFSPTPRIALADTYVNFAWKARGGDLADKVTEEGWRLFDERIKEACETLEQARQISRDDPEWYNAMLIAAAAQGWNKSQSEALVAESLSREPGYFYIVRVQANNLLPKWYGEPGDTERFVEKTADRIGGAEGDATYFFVAESVLTETTNCSLCSPPPMSWTRIQRGYAAIARLYGTNNFEKNAYAYLAVQAGDRETARSAFEKIGDNWDPDVWGSRTLFERDRMFPNLKPAPLNPPEPANLAH